MKTGTVGIVGDFYLRLSQYLLSNSSQTGLLYQLPQTDVRGDLFHGGIEAVIEVKGSNNCDPFKLFAEQLDTHMKFVEKNDLLSLYFLYSYRNREFGWSTRFISKQGNKQRKFEYLAANTTSLVVVDGAVIQKLHQLGYGGQFKNYAKSRMYVHMTRRLQNAIARNPFPWLDNLDIPRQGYLAASDTAFPCHTLAFNFQGMPMQLKMAVIAPIAAQQFLAETLRPEIDKGLVLDPRKKRPRVSQLLPVRTFPQVA